MLVLNLPFKALMFLTLMRPSLVLFLVLWLKLVKDFLKVRCRLALLPFLISCLIWLDLVASLPLIKERILVIILLLHFLSLMLGSVLVLMLSLLVWLTPDLRIKKSLLKCNWTIRKRLPRCKMRLKKRLLAFSRRLHARIRKTRYMHKMRCLLINRRSLLLALRLLWKTPIFPSNSRSGHSGHMTTTKRKSRTKVRAMPHHTRSHPASEARDDLASLTAWFEEKHLEKAKVGAVDIDGVWRGKYLSAEKFFSAAGSGLGFCDVVFGWDLGDQLYDNAAVTGWHTGYPDAQARVDTSTGRIIPWEPDTAAFLLDFVNPDGSPFEPSPRQLLQRMGRRAREMGFLPRFGAEYEFFIFRETAQSLREKSFVNLATLTPGMFGYSWLRSSSNAPLVHAILDGCREFGIEIEGMHTETGAGVYEAAIRYDELAKAADNAGLFKTVVKEVCNRHGLTACFMAKWNPSLPGCSGHVHQSLWNLAGDRNLFFDAC